MPTQTSMAAPVRKGRHLAPDYIERGLPDPRPVTTYTATISTVSGHNRITIVLSQPCVIRNPSWGFLSCLDGSRVTPASMTIVDNKTFYFDFGGVLSGDICFVDVPYQDTQVQNFQGGFVKSGGQWFRMAVLPS